MPKLNGDAAARAMREIERSRDQPRKPIVVLTAHVGSGISFSDPALDGVLAKPVTRSRVLQLLATVVTARCVAETARVGSGSISRPLSPNVGLLPMDPRTSDLLSGSGSDRSASSAGSVHTPAALTALRLRVKPLADRVTNWLAPVTRVVQYFARGPESDIVQSWRLHGCMIVFVVNTLLMIALSVLRVDHIGPLPYARTTLAAISVLLLVLAMLLRFVRSRNVLAGCVYLLQIVCVFGTLWRFRVLPHTVLPFSLNVATGTSFRQSAISVVCVIMATIAGVVARGEDVFGSFQLTREDAMSEFALHIYLLVFSGIFVFYLSLTRRRNLRSLEEARAVAVANAAAVNHKKRTAERFFSALSFDLRTPLNVVDAVAERLSQLRGLSASAAKRVRIIQSAAQVLFNIIVNMVDVKTMEHGGMLVSPEPKPVALVSLARRVGTIMVFYAHRKQLKLRRRIAPSVPRAVSGDPLRLQQILINLVQNAIRYVGNLVGLKTSVVF
jgi:signal transduction histidine kinase